MTHLPTPIFDTAAEWVASHLGHLCSDAGHHTQRFPGGQTAADAALADFDVAGYAATRNEVLPPEARGASRLSPYIRYNLLHLQRVWNHVEGGPSRDVAKFRDELLWQEYARHWYAAYGTATREGTRYQQPDPNEDADPWPGDMRCVAVNLEELHDDGWVVNQARMWLASQWAVRHNAPWRAGEDWFFRHLLDGSRAANRLGWQWTGGLSKQKAYGFSRQQVLRRAPGLCATCPLENDCPIGSWPDPEPRRKVDSLKPTALAMAGPATPDVTGDPEAVWITAESMGNADPALAAHPDLPVAFVFDEPLLASLRLASKRLVFLAETIADLGQRRDVEVHLGRPTEVLAGRRLAVTHAPVPGFRRIAAQVDVVAHYPYPWLRLPTNRGVASFSQWR